MKNIFVTLICILSFTITNAQSNKEIASVYIKRSEESLNNLEIKLSKEHFDKAMKYLDAITTSKVAKLGMKIYFELGFYEEAKEYSKQYFTLVKNRKTEEYMELLDLSVDINEELENQIKEQKRIEAERLKKEKELRRIDSLKTVWAIKSESLSIKADSIYKFNKNSIAIYKKADFFGAINDLGEIIVEANEFVDVLNFDGYIIFKNKIESPTKLFCFNSNNNSGYQIPNMSDFNPLSTHYGKVMLPRGNGRLVTYPNNAHEPLIFDLNVKKVVKIENKVALLKNLKKNDIIDKYNKDGEVKINKKWYNFGGHLGGGIHPLYTVKGYKLEGFLCSIDGKLLSSTSDYQFIGPFYNNKYQAIKGTQVFWINQNGTKVSAAKEEAANYLGNSKLVKLEKGSYQIMKDNMIVLGDEKLEKITDYLRKFANKE